MGSRPDEDCFPWGGRFQRRRCHELPGGGRQLLLSGWRPNGAATHVGGVQKYWYDANGNATRRLDGSQDVTLTYDAENRLTAISGSVASSYVYDADGNWVKV